MSLLRIGQIRRYVDRNRIKSSGQHWSEVQQSLYTTVSFFLYFLCLGRSLEGTILVRCFGYMVSFVTLQVITVCAWRYSVLLS